MPHLALFREANGRVPFIEWQDRLTQKARAHTYVSLERLRQFGHELRRPEADYLADGIHELRFRCAGVNYRILYFFHGREAVVISHGIVKQQARVPVRELDLARSRKLQFTENPRTPHTPGGLIMPRQRPPTTDALKILHRRYFEGHSDRLAGLELARKEAAIARKIYELRTDAGLTQQQLAKLVGTTTSVISRLEDADYGGYSLKTLQRIAAALDCVVEVRFVPRAKRSRRASAS